MQLYVQPHGERMTLSVILQFVLLLASSNKLLANDKQRRNNDKSHPLSCSMLLLENYHNTSNVDNNSRLDDCNCETLDTMSCPKFSSLPFVFNYIGHSKELTLTGEKMKKDFDTVAQYVGQFLNDVDVYTVTLVRFCGEGVDYDVIADREFKSVSEDLLSVLNCSRFHGENNISKLDLSSNCAGTIIGNFKNSFRNLVELDISGNLLKIVPDGTFEGLTELQSLKLDMNRLESITRASFSGLTSLTSLSMFSNYLETVAEDVFGELVNLESLQLRNNRIVTVSLNAFHNNVQLTSVILSRNLIEDIPPETFSTLTKLTHLSIHECRLHSLPTGLLKGLVRLKSAVFYNNNISHIPPDTFLTNRMLKEAELSGNKLSDLPEIRLGPFGVDGPPSFHLANNGMKNLQIPLVKRVKVAKQLDLSRNCFNNITEIEASNRELGTSRILDFACEKCCLDSVPKELLQSVVSSVNFGQNRIPSLDTELLSNVAHLNSVDLSHNLITTVRMEWVYPYVQNDSKAPYDNPVTKIILRSNPFTCDCALLPFLTLVANEASPPKGLNKSLMSFDISNSFCQEPKNLRGKRLNQILRTRALAQKLVCNITTDCPELCHCFLLAIDNLVVVNCASRGMSSFPVLPQIGKPLEVHLENNKVTNLPAKDSPLWHLVRELYVQNNVLSSLSNLTITSALTVLHIDNNELSEFHQEMFPFFNSYNNVSLFLSGNPWKCNCELQKLKAWIYSEGQVMDFKQIECIFPETNSKVLLASATDLELCPELHQHELLLKVLLPVIAAITVVLSISITLIYRFKPEIQLWLFTRGYCLRFVTEEDVDNKKKYDAFVSYSTKDEEWVATELVPGLENGLPAYSLCLHDRDWPVGEWIADQILKSVEQSRRTIIVLTQNFIESDWSRLEFRAAYRQALTDQVNRVLVVIPGDSLPDLKKLDADLRNYITLNTYIKWTDTHFWRKLRCSMPRVKMNISCNCHGNNSKCIKHKCPLTHSNREKMLSI